jgi:GDPmannose 4,6-dehydratase
MKAIIFGITGQDGSHLADLLLEKEYEVIGVTRRSSTDNTKRIKHIIDNRKFSLVEGDITDVSSVINILRNNENVDEVYNLAAQSHVGTSFTQPSLTWDITGKGCLNILQSLVDLELLNVRFYQASSSEMFGKSYSVDHNGVKYQDENTVFLPQSPYAIAKCSAHYAVRLYREAYGIHGSSGILFNHEGPRRGDNFVTKKVVNWVVNFNNWMEQHDLKLDYLCFSDTLIHGLYDNSFPKLMLGNLDAYRDWGYAGDYVEAMWLMLQQDEPDDYVICTEKTHSIRDLLDVSFGYFGIKNWDSLVGIDHKFYRPAEVDYLLGRSTKARTKLGWHPRYDFKNLIKLMIKERINENLQNTVRHIECV